MSATQRALDDDSQDKQSESEESECEEVLVGEPSIELYEEYSSGDEESELGEDDDRPGKKKMKAKYKRKKADWMDVKVWDRQTTEDKHINQEILKVADDFMQQCSLPFITGLHKKSKQPPLGM
jgi:hypothetical protein